MCFFSINRYDRDKETIISDQTIKFLDMINMNMVCGPFVFGCFPHKSHGNENHYDNIISNYLFSRDGPLQLWSCACLSIDSLRE